MNAQNFFKWAVPPKNYEARQVFSNKIPANPERFFLHLMLNELFIELVIFMWLSQLT